MTESAPHGAMRSRSNTSTSGKGSRRPKSRGSTASINSSTTQFTQEHAPDGPPPYMPPQPHPGHHVSYSNPEEMIMCYGDQLSQPNQSFPLDPSLQESHNVSNMPQPPEHHFDYHEVQYHGVLPARMQHGLPQDMQNAQFDAFGVAENQQPETSPDDHENSENGSRKKKGSASSLANDKELRRLVRQYEAYSLQQMATEVQKHEGGGAGKSEKVKQVFAMLWLKETCKKSSGSVRRDRVFHRYADRCGTERVPTLNPASFGKLVRIIFPDVQTRRLGVRGESKYHYVDLSLIDGSHYPVVQQGNVGFSGLEMHVTRKESEERVQLTRSASIPTQPQLPTDTAVFPSPSTSFPPVFPQYSRYPDPPSREQIRSESSKCRGHKATRALVFLNSDAVTEETKTRFPKDIEMDLKFPSSKESVSSVNEPLRLPSIHSYLPENTDPDVADALTTLYRSHCISVIDSLRFCKERMFFRHYTAFNGTLTVPVQKLLAHEKIAPWIEECDWVMYQKMVAFVAPLTTQAVPKTVLDTIKNISHRLTPHIVETFDRQPEHVVMAKIKPATGFAHLLNHLIVVNQSAHNAAAWLSNSVTRNQMWEDLVRLIDPRQVLNEAGIPDNAMAAAWDMLTHDFRALLQPLDDSITQLEASSTFFKHDPQYKSPHAHTIDALSTNGPNPSCPFPDNWIAFILNLPNIFPDPATPDQTARCPGCIGSMLDRFWFHFLKHLSLAGGQSWPAWWTVNVFFSTMIMWKGEMGGFLERERKYMDEGFVRHQVMGLRMNGAGKTKKGQLVNGTGAMEHDQEAGNGSAVVEKGLGAAGVSLHDDSGISLGLDDDHEYEHDHLDGATMHSKYADMTASDPADAEGDVVVV